MTISQRVSAFKSTALEMLQKGESIEDFKNAAKELSVDEMYEATQGILSAIEDFKRNPQLKIV